MQQLILLILKPLTVKETSNSRIFKAIKVTRGYFCTRLKNDLFNNSHHSSTLINIPSFSCPYPKSYQNRSLDTGSLCLMTTVCSDNLVVKQSGPSMKIILTTTTMLTVLLQISFASQRQKDMTSKQLSKPKQAGSFWNLTHKEADKRENLITLFRHAWEC